MKNIKKLIKDVTGLSVTVLAQGHDNNTNLYGASCIYNSFLCYVTFSSDGEYINIFTDDYATLQKISQILYDKKNKKSFIYTNNLYNFNSLMQYQNFLYRLEVVTHEEYYKELKKEIRQKNKKGR